MLGHASIPGVEVGVGIGALGVGPVGVGLTVLAEDGVDPVAVTIGAAVAVRMEVCPGVLSVGVSVPVAIPVLMLLGTPVGVLLAV